MKAHRSSKISTLGNLKDLVMICRNRHVIELGAALDLDSSLSIVPIQPWHSNSQKTFERFISPPAPTSKCLTLDHEEKEAK